VRALACLPACRRRPAALPWAVGAQRMGHIVVASATQLCLRTLNGRTLAEAAVAAGAPPAVTAMAQTTGAPARPPARPPRNGEKRRETAPASVLTLPPRARAPTPYQACRCCSVPRVRRSWPELWATVARRPHARCWRS
jgi:hypothetical protein